jgi:hypothetical protein
MPSLSWNDESSALLPVVETLNALLQLPMAA